MHYAGRIVSLVMIVAAVWGQPATALRPRATQGAQAAAVASYRMDVQLDPEAKTVAGSERITYRNPSQDSLGEIYLRLYLKAFSGPDSLWMRESGGQLRGYRMSPNEPGDITLQTLRTAGGADLLASATLSDTLLRVPLPRPLGPGQTLELDAAWSSKLPRAFARTGYGGRDDTFFMVGQWYPKMAVYDRGRWDTEPWHANAEFFNDFGDYDVTIRVPQQYIVAGAGIPAGEQLDGASKTLRYRSASVTDYAWAASPDFQTSSARAGPTEIALYYLPEHASSAQAYLDTAVRSLESYGAWYGAYPWPRLTVVDVPDDASGAGGMEYPTLVTGGTGGLPAGAGFVEYVTSHEIGHQWWPMQTATNEGREPWLDEGLTEYSGIRLMQETNTRVGFGSASLGAAAFERVSYASGDQQALNLNAWQYSDSAYGTMVYNKTALGLWTLEDVAGSSRFHGAMAAYLDQNRFKHPTGAEFRAALEASLGELDWFFDDYVAGGTIDYAVGQIQNGNVIIERTGAVRVPVDIQITFADGKQRSEVWNGRAAQTTLSYDGATVARVVIDPAYKLHAEVDRRDNQLGSHIQLAPAVTLGGRLSFWTQLIAQALGFFG